MEFNEVIDLLNETAEVIYEEYLKAGKAESPRLYDRFLAVSNAVDLLNDQAQKIGELEEQQPKWIPINERKPNSCGVYIVARWFIDGCRRMILTDACYYDGSNTWHDDTRVNHSRPYLTDKIVAWMPLPEAPKDGEQE